MSPADTARHRAPLHPEGMFKRTQQGCETTPTASRGVRRTLVFFVALSGCVHGAGPQRPDPVADVSSANPALVAVLQRRITASNAHDFDTWESLHTPTCTRMAPELDAPLEGAPSMRAALERLVSAFPDYHLALVRAVGDGPWLAAELRSSGQFENGLEVPGHWLKIPATGKRFEQTWTAFIRFEGDRIAEFREHYDQSDLSDQLMGKTRPKPW